MTPRSLLGLGIVTLIAAIGAVVTVADKHAESRYTLDEEPVFGGLEEQLNSVASFTVEGDGTSLTIRRDGARWTMDEKHGYAVDAEKARNVLFQMSQLRLAEPKTAEPKLYPRIQVSDVNAEGSKSRHVSVADADGKVLADILVGKSRPMGTAGLSGVYIRRPNEARAWLARGSLDVRAEATYWLDIAVVDIAADRVRKVSRKRSGDETMVVLKDNRDDTAYRIEGLPEDAKAKETDLNAWGRALAGLRLIDVAPADVRDLPESEVSAATVTTFDGLVIDLTVHDGDEGIWARIRASVAEGAEDGVAAEADAINARVDGWVYQVPESSIRPLLKDRADFIES